MTDGERVMDEGYSEQAAHAQSDFFQPHSSYAGKFSVNESQAYVRTIDLLHNST